MGKLVGTAAVMLAVYLFAFAGSAAAANGDIVAHIPAPEATLGDSIASDGQILYYTILGAPEIERRTITGAALNPIPVVGIVGGIQVLSYDATRDAFWAIDDTGRDVYLIFKTGVAFYQFTIDDATMLPGECDNGSPVAPGAPLGCPTNVDGLAYDAGDDSIWFSPDASQRIYHFTTDGMLLGFYDVNEPGSQMEPDCANFSSGIAVADHSPTPIMFDMAGSCSNWFQYGSSDVNQPTKQQVYRTYDGTRAEDDECGYAQLPNGQLVSAVWVRDEQDGILRAFQVPSCIVGGGVAIAPDKSRMTGGGGLPTVDPLTGLPNGGTAHHGFMLHCSAQVNPSRLQVSWGNGNHFHMTTIDTSSCTNTAHPTAPSTFDTITGSGHGRYNGHPGATVQWTFKDNGEPGSTDYGDVTVRDQNGVVVMHAQGVLATGSLPGEGNYQSHQAS